jgi:hypothetical protein
MCRYMNLFCLHVWISRVIELIREISKFLKRMHGLLTVLFECPLLPLPPSSVRIVFYVPELDLVWYVLHFAYIDSPSRPQYPTPFTTPDSWLYDEPTLSHLLISPNRVVFFETSWLFPKFRENSAEQIHRSQGLLRQLHVCVDLVHALLELFQLFTLKSNIK